MFIAITTVYLIVITTTCQTVISVCKRWRLLSKPTNVTSCNLLGGAVLIINLTRRVYKSLFENLEEELSTEANKMKKSEYSISEIVFEWNVNIPISEYSLTSLILNKSTEIKSIFETKV